MREERTEVEGAEEGVGSRSRGSLGGSDSDVAALLLPAPGRDE